MKCHSCDSRSPMYGDNYCSDCGAELPTDFEEGQTYLLDALPDNEMNKSGKLEWVADDTLALSFEDMVVEFEWSHVFCKDVKFIDKETGDLYESREALDEARDTDER